MSPATLPRGHCQFRVQPQAASLWSRTTGRSLLPFAKARRGSPRLRGAPLGGSLRQKGRRCSLQTFTRSLSSKPATVWLQGRVQRAGVQREARLTYLSVFCSPAENSSKVILQLQVPHRESGLWAAPATVGTRAPALCTPSQAPPVPAAAARSALLAQLALGPSPRLP